MGCVNTELEIHCDLGSNRFKEYVNLWRGVALCYTASTLHHKANMQDMPCLSVMYTCTWHYMLAIIYFCQHPPREEGMRGQPYNTHNSFQLRVWWLSPQVSTDMHCIWGGGDVTRRHSQHALPVQHTSTLVVGFHPPVTSRSWWRPRPCLRNWRKLNNGEATVCTKHWQVNSWSICSIAIAVHFVL